MRHLSYRAAIEWIADNDDTLWLDDEDPIPSVTAVLVADLFGVDESRVMKDLRRRLGKEL